MRSDVGSDRERSADRSWAFSSKRTLASPLRNWVVLPEKEFRWISSDWATAKTAIVPATSRVNPTGNNPLRMPKAPGGPERGPGAGGFDAGHTSGARSAEVQGCGSTMGTGGTG